MIDKPILFSGPMVRALLAGTKTQTRRALNPQPNMLNGGVPLNNGRGAYSTNSGWKRYRISAGDRLYVRENIKVVGEHVDYQADWPEGRLRLFKWTPSIHMPKRFSRITLHVTDVRVQRLQDISEEDARSEGIVPFIGPQHRILPRSGYKVDLSANEECIGRTAVEAYASLWTAIHGDDAWDENPWVAAYTFTVEHAALARQAIGEKL